MNRYNFSFRRCAAVFTAAVMLGPCVWGGGSADEVQAAAAQMRRDCAVIAQKTGQDGAVATQDLLRWLGVAGTASAGAWLSVRAYDYVKRNTSWLRFKNEVGAYLDLRLKQQALAQQYGKGVMYPAKELGEKNIALLNEMLESWKTGNAFNLPRAYGATKSLAYRVKNGAEKEFGLRAGQMYADYIAGLRITPATQLIAGELGLPASFIKDARFHFERRLLRDMKKGGALSALVTESHSRSASHTAWRSVTRGKKTPEFIGAVSRMYKKYFMPLMLAGAVCWATAEDAQAQRCAARGQDLSLFVNLTAQTRQEIAASPVLTKEFLAAADAIHRLAQLPAETLQMLGEEQAAAARERQREVVRQVISSRLQLAR